MVVVVVFLPRMFRMFLKTISQTLNTVDAEAVDNSWGEQ